MSEALNPKNAPSQDAGQADKTKAQNRTRDSILAAAEDVFGEAGLKGATTREIAKRAGVNETTLFRQFNSKDSLLEAVIEKNMAEARSKLESQVHPSGNLAEDLLTFSRFYCDFIRSHEPMIRVCMSAIHRLPEHSRKLFQVTNIPTHQRVRSYFETARQKGEMRPDLDCLQVSQAFLSTLLMAVMKMGVIDYPYTQDAYIKTVVDIFIHGVKKGA